MSEISLSPELAVWAIGVLVALGVVASLTRIRRSPVGTALRILTFLLLGAFLLSPQWRQEEGTAVPDIAVILEDESRSLSFAERAAIGTDAADRLEARLVADGLEVRRTQFGGRTRTDLDEGLERALADVPRRRLSGIFVLTDGQIHETGVPSRRLNAPLHALILGDATDQRDRRVEIVNAPRFGVVGEQVDVTFQLHAHGETGSLPAELFVDGELYTAQSLPTDQPVTLTVPLNRPGDRLIELRVAEAPGELTTLNNSAVAGLTAVRDRLRVLLVSGEPHAGERVWRNILKSDPAVDLVHFTILKPVEKTAVAAREELNLIEFPHTELFLEKLRDFDVLIFDRYTYRGVLEAYEFEEIARYVERGGAVLIASGPEFTDTGSLARRPNLNYILPITPSNQVVERPFLPERSEIGDRHPVTGSIGDSADWGRWFRYVAGSQIGGETLLEAEGNPLLVVDTVGSGRIAVLMSDHIWLWSRGIDGGGPHRELLRRLVHWLMKEPELEAEALGGTVTADNMLTIERRSLADTVPDVDVQTPDGETLTLPLTERSPGTFVATTDASSPGLYRLRTDGPEGTPLVALAASGERRVPETEAVLSTGDKIRPRSEATDGGVYTLPSVGAPLPTIRRVAEGRVNSTGSSAAIIRRDVRMVERVRLTPLLPAWGWLFLIGGAAIAAWLAEGQRFSRMR